MTTAIIVTDKGEVFLHWAIATSYSPSGAERYYTVPEFGVPKQILVKEFDLHPFGTNVGDTYWINEPYLYDSVYGATQAMKKMQLKTNRRLAVVF
jgi:hypothetical protein